MNIEQQKNNSKPSSSNQGQSDLQNENQNSEDYQQIHNQDVMNAQQSQERTNTGLESISQNQESNSQKSSQQVQEPQIPNQEKPKEQERKINALYFIGVNSLVMNVLFSRQLYFLNYIWVQILVLVLTNVFTYISLHKFKESKELFKQVKEGSSSLKQKAKRRITKKRVLLTFGVLLCTSLLIITIIQIIRVKELKENYRNLLQYVNNDHYRINSLTNEFNNKFDQLQQYNQQTLNQYNIHIQNQEQIIFQLNNKLNQLEILAKRKTEEIDQLMFRLNNQQRQQIFQNTQTNNLKEQSQQTQEQIQQKNTNSYQQSINKGQTQERPEYPRIKQPIREEVRCQKNLNF
ncbi:hypothetical protein ABPG74_018443 [Tetrahymena malaccensis]